jgi:hypothetical protein
LAASWCASACTRYEALNAPPPERVAELDQRAGVVSLSPGVALALECTSFWGERCEPERMRVADARVAEVHAAHLGHLEQFRSGRFVPTSFVVVGVSPGETSLTIPGEDPLRIVVVPDH